MIRAALIAVSVIAIAAGVAVVRSPSGPPKPGPVTSPSDMPLDFVILDPARMIRVRIEVTVNGRALSAVWDNVFAGLIALYDRNGDGVFDRAEAARLPSAFSLRQLLWGRSAPHTGRPVPWNELDAGRKGQVGAADVAHYYRSVGVGGVSVAFGRSPTAPDLSAGLVRILDADGDGTISSAEWKAAPDRLRPLDRNGDEFITASELVPTSLIRALRVSACCRLLQFPKTRPPPTIVRSSFFLVTRPISVGRPISCAAVTETGRPVGRHRSGIARGSVHAPRHGRGQGAVAHRTGRLAKAGPRRCLADRNGGVARRRAEAGDCENPSGRRSSSGRGINPLRPAGRAGAIAGRNGGLPQAIDGSVRRGYPGASISPEEVGKRSMYDLQQLLAVADRDSDGHLSRAELAAWLDVQESVAKAHVLVTILDHGRGLFELLDTDHDGGLSVPELQAAAGLAPLAVRQGGLPDLPHHLFAVVSRGHPQDALASLFAVAPIGSARWTVTEMVSCRAHEFTGPAEVFDRLDVNKDGRISVEEVTAGNGKR